MKAMFFQLMVVLSASLAFAEEDCLYVLDSDTWDSGRVQHTGRLPRQGVWLVTREGFLTDAVNGDVPATLSHLTSAVVFAIEFNRTSFKPYPVIETHVRTAGTLGIASVRPPKRAYFPTNGVTRARLGFPEWRYFGWTISRAALQVHCPFLR